MALIKTTDNTKKNLEPPIGELGEYSGKTLADLKKDARVQLFSLGYQKNDGRGRAKTKKSVIFNYSHEQNTLKTYNIMGYLGRGTTQLYIRSRFCKEENADFFLHYMLRKVFSPQIVNFDLLSDEKEEFWDFYMYFFPAYLKKALNQGIYKRYENQEYNDNKPRGPLQVPVHIKKNTPFRGNVAYRTREYSSDNAMMQLIRHTIEFLKVKPLGSAVLSGCEDECRKIIELTPSYRKEKRQSCLKENL